MSVTSLGGDRVTCGTLFVCDHTSQSFASIMHEGVLWDEPHHQICMGSMTMVLYIVVLYIWCIILTRVGAGDGRAYMFCMP